MGFGSVSPGIVRCSPLPLKTTVREEDFIDFRNNCCRNYGKYLYSLYFIGDVR